MERNGLTQVTMPKENIKAVTPTRPVNQLCWFLMTVILTVFYGSYTVLVHLCEVDGQIPFNSSSLVLMMELCKLMVSLVLYLPEFGVSSIRRLSLRFALPFTLPALLYCFNNNIAVHMQLHMDPATYQVLSNLKILSTAFLYRLIIKRPIRPIQWLALFLLALAGVSNSYGGLQKMMSPGEDTNSHIHITATGITMITLYCLISGLAGVYTEYILKKHYQSSIHLQNLILYSFGVLFNSAAYLHQEWDSESGSFFKGFSIYTWIVVLTQGLSGLMFSAIMKHASNIARLFVISCAMLVTTVLSVVIFDLQLNVYFLSSFVLVAVALVMYHSA